MQHVHDLSPWQHRHDFAADRGRAERRTHWVIGITLVMMVAEIAAGWWWRSMALMADGWHMGTHAAAIGVAAVSYALVRRWSGDRRFSLGPWKVEVLGAYTSAVLLGIVAIGIAIESGLRLWSPEPVAYEESLVVAAIGLIVNAVCAKLLHAEHGHHEHDHAGHAHDEPVHSPSPRGASHGHEHAHDDARRHAHEDAHCHSHDHDLDRTQAPHATTATAEARPAPAAHPGDDLNLKAAYLHVLADAATSVLAIAALLGGKLAGWLWLDAAVGLLGAVLIAVWSVGLLRQTSKILLDREMDDPVADQVRDRLQADGDARVADLHLCRVSDAKFAVQATLVADVPLPADAYRRRLGDLPSVAHATIEINRCPAARTTQPA